MPQLRPGKVPAQLLARLFADLPESPVDVRLGPSIGEDAAVVDVTEGVLVAATDPITLTARDAGRMAVIVNANDVAVTGVRPRWFLAAILLPPATSDHDLEDLFALIRSALDDVGASLVGGHTEVTAAVNEIVVVGQMLGLAPDGRFVTTGGARPGDALVQVGPAPVEGAAVLAAEAGSRLDGLAAPVLEAAARAAFDPGISVVDPALSATALGATALHDPTEGGLASGLGELAGASGLGLRIDRDRVQWFEPGLAVCDALGADPWATLASGALLATFPDERVEPALAALAAEGHRAERIGVAEPGSGVRDRRGVEITTPQRDEVARVLSS